MSVNRTKNFIATIPMKNEEQVIEVKKVLEQIFGWVTLKGRHSNRKSVVNGWRKWAQNDVPWKVAEYIDIYLHPKNPNYNSTKGIQRQNMKLNDNSVIVARRLGNMKLSLADGYYNTIQSKGTPAYIAIMTMYNQSKQKAVVTTPPKVHRNSKQPYGHITKQIWQFMNNRFDASFTELKTYYDVDIRGNKTIINGGSFIHHHQSLTKPSKKRGWYLAKQINGKYALRDS
jgi:hypothetical protein